jgi:heme exporter protein D
MMTQFTHWLMMGGYSAYVWPAYGLVSSVLIINLLTIKWQIKRAHKKLQQWLSR